MIVNDLMESLAWSSAQVKRATRSCQPEVVRVGVSLIDRQTGRVRSEAGERWLRAKELELLLHLYDHAPIAFTRQELLEHVWHCQPNLVTRTVDQTVATLRAKIEISQEQPHFLQTVYGVGYRLVL